MKTVPNLPNCYYRTSVKALISNEAGEVLVVRESGKAWDLPGGGLEWGESAESALLRELKEELGCEAKLYPHPALIVPFHNAVADYHLLWIIYRATIDATKLCPTDDVTEQKFMKLDDLEATRHVKEEENWKAEVDFPAALARALAT